MRGTLAALVVLASVGCAPPDGTAASEVRALRSEMERDALCQELDRLGERMVADAARVRLWSELRALRQTLSPAAYASELFRESAPAARRRYVERAVALAQPAEPAGEWLAIP